MLSKKWSRERERRERPTAVFMSMKINIHLQYGTYWPRFMFENDAAANDETKIEKYNYDNIDTYRSPPKHILNHHKFVCENYVENRFIFKISWHDYTKNELLTYWCCMRRLAIFVLSFRVCKYAFERDQPKKILQKLWNLESKCALTSFCGWLPFPWQFNCNFSQINWNWLESIYAVCSLARSLARSFCFIIRQSTGWSECVYQNERRQDNEILTIRFIIIAYRANEYYVGVCALIFHLHKIHRAIYSFSAKECRIILSLCGILHFMSLCLSLSPCVCSASVTFLKCALVVCKQKQNLFDAFKHINYTKLKSLSSRHYCHSRVG